jgi:hypothetical protein
VLCKILTQFAATTRDGAQYIGSEGGDAALAGKWSPTRAILEFLRSDPLSPNDEPVGGGANEIEGITGNQGKNLASAGIQHRDIRGTDNASGHDPVAVFTG